MPDINKITIETISVKKDADYATLDKATNAAVKDTDLLSKHIEALNKALNV